jgi:hypothetical protein
MEKIYKIASDAKIGETPVGGYISVKVISRAERLKMRADAMVGGKSGDELEAELMYMAQNELIKRVKKVDIKFGDDHFKTKECLEYYDEIAELFIDAVLEIATGPKLGKK